MYPSVVDEHLGCFQVLAIKNKADLKKKKKNI